MEASSFVPNRPTLDRSESFTVVSSSTKRRHHHYTQPPSSSSSSSQTFRQLPPPPIKLSSGEALFRILCPATKTGGVIGKGGSIIRQLREDTGAKIRIDDPIPGCEERVILIVAAHSATKKKDKDKETSSSYASASASAAVEEGKQTVVDTNREEAEELTNNSTSNLNYEEQEEEMESPAQQALLRIFERILKVKEERSSGESNKISSSSSDNDNNKEGGVTVVCRLLAPSSQIGSVLGKGGKIIERIRHDSGAHVRVLHHDLLPPCSSPGDELIQITGKFSAVRKAVLSVSGCLQDHSRGDVPNSAPIKSSGIALHGTGTENSRMMLEEVVFKLLCQVEKVGSLIGKGGSVIRLLQNDTGASIKIADASPDSDERVVIISARENLEQRHSPSQDAVIRVHSRIAEIGFEPGSAVVARLLVHSQHIGYLFGKGGIIIPELRRVTGASIRIFPKEQFPKYGSQNDEVVQVIGSLQSVQDALFQITSRLREIIFPVNPHQYLPPYPEMPPPMFRPRHDPASPGYPSPVGFSRGGDHGSMPTQPPEPWPTYSHGMDRLGSGYLERVPYPYGSERPGQAPLSDRQLSPGRWSSQAGGGRVSDVGGGFSMTTTPAGSGSQAPVVGRTSVEVVIPQIFLSYVYGENNSNLIQIRRISGANVVVRDPRAGATEGVVVVTGTPDQLRAAQSLIHAFILSERDI